MFDIINETLANYTYLHPLVGAAVGGTIGAGIRLTESLTYKGQLHNLGKTEVISLTTVANGAIGCLGSWYYEGEGWVVPATAIGMAVATYAGERLVDRVQKLDKRIQKAVEEHPSVIDNYTQEPVANPYAKEDWRDVGRL